MTEEPAQPIQPRHPEIAVKLLGQDGNAVAIVARVRTALQRAEIPPEEIRVFTTEALSGDYDHVLQTVMAWVEVE